MAIRFLTCSWCHAGVAVAVGGVRLVGPFCPRCHHRADVARADCDCPRCRRCRDVVAIVDADRVPPLIDLVESLLRHNEPVPPELVDAVIAAYGLRIRV